MDGFELSEGIDAKKFGINTNCQRAIQFLELLDAVTTHIPISDRAAKQEQSNLQALCQKYGLMSWFITVTAEDSQSIEIQAYAGKDIDLSERRSISQISNDELREKPI